MEFIQQSINGIMLGSIYALIAVGYTMVYGIMKLINFAHGEVYMVGAYVAYLCLAVYKLPITLTLIISAFICGILGYLIHKIAYKPLKNAPKIVLLITAIAVSLLIQNLISLIFGTSPKIVPNIIDGYFEIFSITISYSRVLILSVTIVLVIILMYLINRTNTGRAMKAASFDKEAAELMGINSNFVIVLTFVIGSSLAAIAGTLVSIEFSRIDPFMGVMPGLKAFVAAVLGGIGSIQGAMIGGLFLGLIETFTKLYNSQISDAVVFLILIIVLIVKPTGLFGKKISEKV